VALPPTKGVLTPVPVGPPVKGIIPTKGVLNGTPVPMPSSVIDDADYDAFLDDVLTNRLPDKFTELRPHQVVAIREILEAYETGADVVILDAPTGTGKTIIAEVVRFYIDKKATYICNDKALQDQFVRDFHYAKLLKGRSNYPTQLGGGMVTCNDCNKTGGPLEDAICSWCDDVPTCPYQVAKSQALRSRLAVINTAYMLAEMNSVGSMSGRHFGIIDECDTLEELLMGYVQYHLTEDRCKTLGVTVPKKSSHKATIKTWMVETLGPKIEAAITKLGNVRSDDVQAMRRLRGLMRLEEDTARVAEELDDGWVRDYERVRVGGEWTEANSLILKPIMVNEHGRPLVWRHSKKWLLMSATVVSADEMVQSLGMDQEWEERKVTPEGAVLDTKVHEPLDVRVVQAPMMFPVENRPVYYSPVASMSRKDEEADLPVMLESIENLCRFWRADEFPEGVRTLIHAHKYSLAKEIVHHLNRTMPHRKIITYLSAREKDDALEAYKRHPSAILVAVSMGRGVDLPDDLCRLQIMAKVPYPYLGDAQVSARMRAPGGQTWYSTHTARVIMQACGRGVRHVEDWCDMWILDRSFSGFKKDNKTLFPDWWLDGLELVRKQDFDRFVGVGGR
jgi:ATP-dependent DNA helicase DinG